MSRFHPALRNSGNIVALVLTWVSSGLFPVGAADAEHRTEYRDITHESELHTPQVPPHCVHTVLFLSETALSGATSFH